VFYLETSGCIVSSTLGMIDGLGRRNVKYSSPDMLLFVLTPLLLPGAYVGCFKDAWVCDEILNGNKTMACTAVLSTVAIGVVKF
jgi:hypothetical protein